jgi:hypothetical protein
MEITMKKLQKPTLATAFPQIGIVIILAAFAWRIFSSDVVSLKTPVFELKTESRTVKP